jgi:hypothetical protein
MGTALSSVRLYDVDGLQFSLAGSLFHLLTYGWRNGFTFSGARHSIERGRRVGG